VGKSGRSKPANSSPLRSLVAAMQAATKSAKFVVNGTLPLADPGLFVEGIGPVPVPLKRGAVKALIAACHVAPYGKGTETLVDERVRKTFELDPSKFRLGVRWNETIADATRTVADSLGLSANQLEARLYKLLVYEKGGFFLPHRDSEKHDRMVASLIVVLPNPFEGGRLIVRHGAGEQKLPFKEAAAGKEACFAAFYADCGHEVERVNSGVRIALAYNLVLKPGKITGPAKPTVPADALVAEIESWVAHRPAKPLVYALEHHYTERGLSLDLFKGADRQLADLVVPAAEKAGCLVYLAQVTRHLSQFADDGSFDYGYSRYSRRAPRQHAITIGETYEDELSGTEWTNLKGKKQSMGEIAFDLSAIVSSIPIDKWKPTSEEFEGYTGNAGNTLDRWYHRSAVVIWHRDHHYEIITRGHATLCIPEFLSMLKKLPKTPKAKLEAARNECLRFARALVVNWPRRWSHIEQSRASASPCDEFAESILSLHDQGLVAAFLRVLSERDEVTSLKTFVVAACREFGWDAFEGELKLLIVPNLDQYGHGRELSPSDFEWLAEFCGEKTYDPDWRILGGELCKIAVQRFCEKEDQPRWARDRETANDSERSLPLLLQALAETGRDEDFSRVIRFIRELPNEFTLDYGQVPALKLLIPWSRKRFGSVYPPLQMWFETVRSELEKATAQEPAPPSDWARPANVDCRCEFCTQINTFLADPSHDVGRIPASEINRRHVITKIEHHKCDVKHTLERKGSPYSLVFTKTTGSYDRAVKRYEKDCRLLQIMQTLA
jgi:hypothetical protein